MRRGSRGVRRRNLAAWDHRGGTVTCRGASSNKNSQTLLSKNRTKLADFALNSMRVHLVHFQGLCCSLENTDLVCAKPDSGARRKLQKHEVQVQRFETRQTASL